MGGNAMATTPAAPGQGMMPAINQNAAPGAQNQPNAMGMPRPMMPGQQQQQQQPNAMMPMNSAQMPGPNQQGQQMPGNAMNRGPVMNAGLQQQQQQQQGAAAVRNRTLGNLPEGSSNLEHIVSVNHVL